MQYRVDEKSGNKLSILGFGCMRFPRNLGQIDLKKTEMLIMEAIDEGVNYFDTAYIYPGSEEALGKILAKNQVRDRVFIASKLPIMQCKSAKDFDKFLDIQLARLQTDHIDYYFMHALSGMAQWEKLCEWGIKQWLDEKKIAGKIKQVGFSFHGVRDEFTALLEAYDWDFCQIQYNYMNINYQAGVHGLKRAAEKGLPVIIMEPLLGGRLATGLPTKVLSIFRSAGKTLSPVGWALKWLWNQPEVTVVLSGMNELPQLQENIELAGSSVPAMFTKAEDAVIAKVMAAFNATYKIPCTGCNYCMPCPQGINIPGCFSAYNASFAISSRTGLQQYFMNVGVMSKAPHLASDCTKCGKCEKHCPQQIAIRDSLQEVSKKMQPFWFKPVVALVKRFM